MAISYKKLFKMMIDLGIKKKELKEMTGLSYGTIAKLEKGSNVEVSVLEKICVQLNCQLSDIAEVSQK